MRTIHKYSLDPSGAAEFTVMMPRNADILCVHTQRGAPVLWALVDDENAQEARLVAVIGTGWEVPDGIGFSDYIGTFQTEGGFVWHVFVAKPNALGAYA
jgi:hypothetical protein